MTTRGLALAALFAAAACGAPTGVEEAADVVGEVLSVEVAFDAAGPESTVGRVGLRTSALACDIAIELTGMTHVRDRDGPMSLLQLAEGDVVQAWTRDAVVCDRTAVALEVALTSYALRRSGSPP